MCSGCLRLTVSNYDSSVTCRCAGLSQHASRRFSKLAFFVTCAPRRAENFLTRFPQTPVFSILKSAARILGTIVDYGSRAMSGGKEYCVDERIKVALVGLFGGPCV